MVNDFKRLEDYGIVGNMDTCALIGKDGSIDWCCFPHLESKSVFAALLDINKGGHFYIRPATEFTSNQAYINHTNILETNFKSDAGQLVLTDFFPVISENDRVNSILRKLTCIDGHVEVILSFKPRFDYARVKPVFKPVGRGIVAQAGEERLFLQSSIQLTVSDSEVNSRFVINKGETLWFALNYNNIQPLSDKACEEYLVNTEKYWLSWIHRCGKGSCVFAGPWHESIVRSGLVLKLLTHSSSGAIAAAATTSLPEEIGGQRNWDYRFAWIRDASFTVQALYNLGNVQEADAYLRWLKRICVSTDVDKLQIMYGLHGETDLEEVTLEHLSGYKNLAPVRIGNKAATQKQIDIYGELINALYELSRYSLEISPDEWNMIRNMADYVSDVWREKDSGIWEIRDNEQHYTYSKLMCWVALDRTIKIAEDMGFSNVSERWQTEREKIRDEILHRGFSKKLNSFVQSYDSLALDATSLLIPMMGLLPFDDPRILSTIEATINNLMVKGFVKRYNVDDGLTGTEGAFVLCTCWLVNALCLSGQVEKAETVFQELLEHSSPLGLFAEEIDPISKQQIGNFPQAFSHIGIINSAIYLGRAKGLEVKGPELLGMEPVGDKSYGGNKMENINVDFLVIGGGGGGITAANTANGLGKSVAIVEKSKLGGECTWTGCVPSKALIRASHIAHNINNMKDYGLVVKNELELNTNNVMAHVRAVREKVYEDETPQIFESKGIKVFFGEPEFLDNHQVKIGDTIIRAEKIVITTGSRPAIPSIEGIESISYLNNNNLFDLEYLPESLIAIGAGPISIELSQALHRLGVKVTIVHRSGEILKRDDQELALILKDVLVKEGIDILINTRPVKVAHHSGGVVLTVEDENNEKRDIFADMLFTGVGRKANTEGLKLEKAGVEYTAHGIKTDEHLKTTAPNIYACGDVVGPYRFSHIAEYQAVIATTNALLPLKKKVDYSNIIWATFTDPEFAHLGLTESEAREKHGDNIKIFRYEYKKLDRAKTDLATTGMAKFICDHHDKLVGAHILGNNAGELIHEAQIIKSFNIAFSKIQSVIHAYPTYSDITRQAGKQDYIQKLQNNPLLKVLKKLTSKEKHE